MTFYIEIKVFPLSHRLNMYVYIHVYSYACGHGVLEREQCVMSQGIKFVMPLHFQTCFMLEEMHSSITLFASYSKLHIPYLNMWLGNTTVLNSSLSATTSSCALWNVLVCRCVHSTGHGHRAIRRDDWLPRSHRSTTSSHALPPPIYTYA